MVQLPENLTEAFHKAHDGAPLEVLRSLYDLEGHLGTTYLAASESGLSVFSLPCTGDPLSLTWPWTQIGKLVVRMDGVFAFLNVQAGERDCVLHFSGWDKAALETVVARWRRKTQVDLPRLAPVPAPTPEEIAPSQAIPVPPPPPPAAVPVPVAREEACPMIAPVEAPTVTPAQPAPAPVHVLPRVAFCASIHAMAGHQQAIETAELHYLAQHLGDDQAIEQGRLWLEEHGIEVLWRSLPDAMNADQKRCLLANLIGAAMVDGVLRSGEQDLLGRFRAVLGLGDAAYQRFFGVLLNKNNLAVFATEGGLSDDGLSPLTAYCAAMHAMARADGEVSPEEEDALLRTVPYPDDRSLGADYLDAYGLDHLLGRLESVLTEEQRCCLHANLLALAMADGVLRSVEQGLLERFQQVLGVTDEEAWTQREVLLVKNRLSVFAET